MGALLTDVHPLLLIPKFIEFCQGCNWYAAWLLAQVSAASVPKVGLPRGISVPHTYIELHYSAR
jgi:hypothetical protein